MASPQQRLQMCRIAITGMSGFEVDDRELCRPPPSYTIDTVRQLLAEGWAKVTWLLGADQVMALPMWHQPQSLLAQADLVIVARPGRPIDWAKLPPEFRCLSQRMVSAPEMGISSTDIRQRVAAGKPIDFLTPPAVCRYIAEQGLYRA
jgi:nicotinate-nucleotide adenylyltransferase